MKPRRRTQGLVVKELPEEVLVYDLERHRAHCLNPTAALVFKHCDGDTTVSEIAGVLRTRLRVPADGKWVHLALDHLEKAHLLEECGDASWAPSSRRELIRRLGLTGAALLPLVSSVVAPTPVEAAATCVDSCFLVADFTPCGTPSCICVCDGGVCTGGSC